jgi:hypothetical protein
MRICDLQQELIANPAKGRVIRGCGGLRKVRVADARRQKGKRGGARVIYLHIPEADQFLMLDIYSKHEKEDLTPSERKRLRNLVREYKIKVVEARRSAEKEKGE